MSAKKRIGSETGDRSTIGFLTDVITEEWLGRMWAGVAEVAGERDVNAICFPGGRLRSPHAVQERQANVLFELVNEERLDGLIIWGYVGSHVGPDELRAFYERYRPLPIVSVAQRVEGVPSVLADNYGGMRQVVAHLVDAHGCDRIAFVAGDEGFEEHEERFRAYRDVLSERGLPLYEDLIVTDAQRTAYCRREVIETGDPYVVAPMRLLLEERGVTFDGLVACEDHCALGALAELEARGLHVPHDVAVAGFDDLPEGRWVTPPLTTARGPVLDMGRRAAEALLKILAGQEVTDEIVVPAPLVVRRSCGCLAPEVERASVGTVKSRRKKVSTALASDWEAMAQEIAQEMTQAVATGTPRQVAQWAAHLLDAFAAEVEVEVEGKDGAFLVALDHVLRQSGAEGVAPGVWQDALSAMRRLLLPHLVTRDEERTRAGDLWEQARVVVAEAALRAQAYEDLQAQQRAGILREVGSALLTTFDVDELMDVLVEGLLRLGMDSGYLSLYEDPQPYSYPDPAPTRARLVLAYNDEGRVALDKEDGKVRRFLTRQLVPKGLLPEGRPTRYVVQPLYSREQQIGLALFEAEPRDGVMTDVLRSEISSSLHGALLLEAREKAEAALEKAYAEVEEQVKARTAELEREIAERERMREESVRLQQEVIDAQKRAIQELSAPIIPVMEVPDRGSIIVMPLIGSIDTMRARDITRSLLAGIREHRAKFVIVDITGVPIVDSGVAAHMNKTIQTARLKGARTIVTGISSAVAETIVDLGIDWSGLETLADLQTGLRAALTALGFEMVQR